MESEFGLVICNKYFSELQRALKHLHYEHIPAFSISSKCVNQSVSDQIQINEEIHSFQQQVNELKFIVPDLCISSVSHNYQLNCNSCMGKDTCTEFFISKAFFEQLANEGNYIITPGWLLNWEVTVIGGWKLTKDNIKDFFSGICSQVCILDTHAYDDYSGALEEFKNLTGLEIRIVHVGLDYFELRIEKIIHEWLNSKENSSIKEAKKKVADYTMAFDIIKDLSSQSSEKQLMQNIFKMFTLLFAPAKMQYTPVNDGIAGSAEIFLPMDYQGQASSENTMFKPEYEILKNANGFKICASYNKEILGYIEVEDILFSEHIQSYIALLNSISSILGLLIYNSREYGNILKEKVEILTKSEQSLLQKNIELQSLYNELQASEEEIRTSNEELRATTDELKDKNILLEKAKIKAEESDRLKTAFLNNMSHEIRTPLNAILGFAQILPKNFKNLEKLEFFSEIINKRGQDLLGIIDEILDIAKIESNQMTLHYNPCNISTLLSEIFDFFSEYQNQINKGTIIFKNKNFIDPGNVVVNTDPIKLRQIFINLINNAFKFTSIGSVEYGLLKEEQGLLYFYIKDSGIGIPKEKFTDIFERFIQINSDESRVYGGTGLGLSIVKGILDLFGGKIWLESEVNKGTTFYFTIPYIKTSNKLSEAPTSQSRQINTSNAVILIVEDDNFNTIYLKEVLNSLHCEILHASSGKEALDISVHKDLDIVLMDIRLPDIDGYQVTRLIKAKNPDLVIIAQTANATSIDRDFAFKSGCSDFIGKPIQKDILLSKIKKFICTENAPE